MSLIGELDRERCRPRDRSADAQPDYDPYGVELCGVSCRPGTQIAVDVSLSWATADVAE